MTTLTDDERRQRLEGLGLFPDGDSLAHNAVPAPKGQPGTTGVRFAPDGVDPHAMAASEIVFADAMLDGFPDLTGQGFKVASDHLFAQYKSSTRDPERHALLHRRITEFIGQVKRSRKTGGVIRERIKATAEQREIAEVLAAEGITAEKLAAVLKAVQEVKA